MGDEAATASREPRMSRLAVVSFVAAVIPCCPATGMLATLLGLMALRRIAASGGALGGRRLATAAALIGMASALLSMYGWNRLMLVYAEEQDRAARTVIESFITAAVDGRYDDARGAWEPEYAPDDAEIAAFAEAVAELGGFERVNLTTKHMVTLTTMEGSVSYEGRQDFALGAVRLRARSQAFTPAYRLERLRFDRSSDDVIALGAERPERSATP